MSTIVIIILLLLMPSLVLCQQPTEQPTKTNAAISVTVDSLKITKTGLTVALSYVNQLKEPIQFTLTHPQEKAGFASDNLGNEYVLINATGMARKHHQPNLDITRPTHAMGHSTFLLAPPHTKVSASFLFKRTTQQAPDSQHQPTTVTLSISHYARPAEKFDPKQPSSAFGFTATITNAKPD